MNDVKIEDLMNMIPRAFVPEKAKGVSAVVLFHLSGEGGGDWVVRIADETCKVEPGTVAKYDLLLEAAAQDALDAFAGKLDPMKAYMQGKIKMTGKMMLAMRLFKMFSVPR